MVPLTTLADRRLLLLLFRFSQIDKTKALKALMSSDHRRQSLTLASKRRRSSLMLERRGTIRVDSRGPLTDTPTDGMLGRKREGSIVAETDSAHPERDSLAEQKGDTFSSVGTESQTEQTSDSVTDQCDTAVKTEQGPPAVRRNTLFPDQDSTNAAQTKEKADDKRTLKELQQNKDVGDDRSSKEPQPIKNDVAQAQGKTDDSSLQPHTLSEVKNIVQGFGVITSKDKIKEQVTVMAQNAIDSKYFILLTLNI